MSSSSSSSGCPTVYYLGVVCFVFLFLFVSADSDKVIPIKGVDIQNPVTHLIPYPLAEYSSTHGTKDTVSCARVRVSGLSRLELKSYANSFQVTLTPSVVIPKKLHEKIQVCIHRNSSRGLCKCANDDWRSIQKGNWSIVMSPYEDRYFDVKFIDGSAGSITVSVDEEFHGWRIYFLGFGFLLLLLAPIFSSWVPFYYSSSMFIGVFLVILVVLFQGMKLLPTGRKNIFYLTIYGSVLGAGSFLLHYFSMLVNSILLNFGLSEDMYNPVSVFVGVGVVLPGAALGYWIVRKFVMSEDGSVDVGIAYFVKWAMRIIATTSIFESTLDTPLALLALASCWAICFLITSLKWRGSRSLRQSQSANGSLWLRSRQISPHKKRAEFLSRSAERSSGKKSWSSPKRSLGWSESPSKGLVLLSPNVGSDRNQDYYSTFHKTSNRKRFSKREWEDFTSESTKQAMAELASSPEFSNWIIENADRIRLEPDPDKSSDDDTGSGSDYSEATTVENVSGLNFFKWY